MSSKQKTRAPQGAQAVELAERLDRIALIVSEAAREAEELAARNAATVARARARGVPGPHFEFSAQAVKVLGGIVQAERRLEKAREALAHGAPAAAIYYLAQAEDLVQMRTLQYPGAISHMVDAAQAPKRQRSRGGEETAKKRKDERDKRIDEIRRMAAEIRAVEGDEIKDVALAALIVERRNAQGFDDGEVATRKLLKAKKSTEK